MRKIFYISILFLIINSTSGSAQNKTVDSLLTVLKTVKADTTKVDILNELAKFDGYQSGNFEKCLQYTQQAKTIAEQTDPPYKKGIASSINIIGNIYYTQSNYSQALNYYTAALKIQEEIENKRGVAVSYMNIGNIYSVQGKYPDALKNYLIALKIAEEIGDKQVAANCHNNVGTIYISQGNYPEALNSFFMTLTMQDKIKDKYVVSNAYNNIGSVYSDQGDHLNGLKNYSNALKIREEIGNKPGIARSYTNIGIIYYKLGNYQEALKNHFAALKISEEIGDKRQIARVYHSIGIVYQELGNYLDALKNHLSALKIREEIGDKQSIATSYISLGSTYLKLQNIPEALFYGTQGLMTAKAMGGLPQIKDAYEILTSIDTARNDFKSAHENYKLYIVYKDSLANEETSKKILRQQMQFDFDKKENQLKYEKQLSEEQLLRSKQELGLRQKELELSNKEKDLKQLAYLKEKAERQEKEKQLSLAEKDKQLQTSKIEVMSKENALQTAQLDIHRQEIATKNAQRNLFIGGTVLMLLLAGSIFVGFKRTSKEKKRSDELLLNILPAEVAEELKTKGAAAAKQMDEVTVLFTDFKAFTDLSEKFTPTELVAEINYCFSAFDHIMQKHGVEKIKTIGDAYMAAGGLPIPNQTHAEDVVRAALDIQQFMFQYQSERQAAGNLFFEVRIGIHTGPVVAGIVGIKKFAYDIWGDTVNTASRMESSGEVGKINISETTYTLVKDRYPCVHRGKISAKGKGEINMYFVEVL